MARPSLRDNWKFKRLVHQLGIPVPHVIGHLECLWQVGYSCGNPFLGDKLSVEAAAEWVGEPERFFNALLDCGFIETTEHDDDLFQIHDLIDHAPDYVKKRADREEEKRRTTADNGGQRRRKHENVCPPTPAPTPVELLRLPSEDSKDVSSTHSSADADATVAKSPLPIEPSQFVESWNESANRLGLPTVREMTGKRKQQFRQRCRDPAWVDGWREALDRIGKSEFLRGNSDRGWQANVDWFLRPDTVVKILEGNYERKNNGMPF